MINNTCNFEKMSFMDGISGYNHIKMCLEDEKYTSFRTLPRVYYYTVMPFDLKNTEATYQWAMMVIFHNHGQKIVECHIDDIIVKSWSEEDHLKDFWTVFYLMRAHQLKMNQTKFFLGCQEENSLVLW